jgi:molecular chaperone DnaK (HSP70)
MQMDIMQMIQSTTPRCFRKTVRDPLKRTWDKAQKSLDNSIADAKKKLADLSADVKKFEDKSKRLHMADSPLEFYQTSVQKMEQV